VTTDRDVPGADPPRSTIARVPWPWALAMVLAAIVATNAYNDRPSVLDCRRDQAMVWTGSQANPRTACVTVERLATTYEHGTTTTTTTAVDLEEDGI
jgi:hypothetical protein